jgi:hypothetical protein
MRALKSGTKFIYHNNKDHVYTMYEFNEKYMVVVWDRGDTLYANMSNEPDLNCIAYHKSVVINNLDCGVFKEVEAE